MAHILDEYCQQLIGVFNTTKNKYESHAKCHPIMRRMAKDDEVIFEVFRRNMLKPTFFNTKRCTPDFQLTLFENPDCFMFVNFFGPNAEKRTDYSYSTMHHHDDYLLSTINAKGKGYTSLIFQQGYEIYKDKMEATVNLDRYVPHSPGHIEFIDCHTAHTLFYPESTTMTYGLWSTFYPTSRMNKFKNSSFVQKNKEWIKKSMDAVRFNVKKIGVAQYREDYFYPDNGKLKFLQGQILPDNGDHFTQNFFNIAQQFLDFKDLKFLKDIYSKLKKGEIQSDATDTVEWVEKSIEGETISRNYDTYDMYVPKRNVAMEEYKSVYNF